MDKRKKIVTGAVFVLAVLGIVVFSVVKNSQIAGSMQSATVLFATAPADVSDNAINQDFNILNNEMSGIDSDLSSIKQAASAVQSPVKPITPPVPVPAPAQKAANTKTPPAPVSAVDITPTIKAIDSQILTQISSLNNTLNRVSLMKGTPLMPIVDILKSQINFLNIFKTKVDSTKDLTSLNSILPRISNYVSSSNFAVLDGSLIAFSDRANNILDMSRVLNDKFRVRTKSMDPQNQAQFSPMMMQLSAEIDQRIGDLIVQNQPIFKTTLSVPPGILMNMDQPTPGIAIFMPLFNNTNNGFTDVKIIQKDFQTLLKTLSSVKPIVKQTPVPVASDTIQQPVSAPVSQ